MVRVKTENGFCNIEPVYCEFTGEHVAWKTVVEDKYLMDGVTPAYLSLNVVSAQGRQLVDLSEVDTF